MNKQIISKTLLMTGLVMLAASASALDGCASQGVNECGNLLLSGIAEGDRADHCHKYHEKGWNNYHKNCTYNSGDNACRPGKHCSDL